MGKGKINLKNIVGIRFKKLGKIYFFNPKGIKVQKGDKVIVETSQGEEYAEVLIPNRNVEDEKIVAPLKKVLRIATNRDKIDTLNNAEAIYKAKEEKIEILDYINIILLDLAKKSSKYAMCINIVEDTKRRLQSNANYDMSIDNMLLKLWEQVN